MRSAYGVTGEKQNNSIIHSESFMAKYTFKQSYPAFWIISFLLILFLGVGIVFTLISILNFDSIILFLSGIIFFFIVALILPRYIASCLIEISMDEKRIKKRLNQKCFFQQKGVQNEVCWEDVQDYVFEPARQFDKFRITLKDGDKLSFYHNNDDDNRDDFLEFVRDFKALLKKRNSRNEIDK